MCILVGYTIHGGKQNWVGDSIVCPLGKKVSLNFMTSCDTVFHRIVVRADILPEGQGQRCLLDALGNTSHKLVFKTCLYMGFYV